MTLAEHIATKPQRLFTVAMNCGTERVFCPETFLFEPQLMAEFGHLEVVKTDVGDPLNPALQPPAVAGQPHPPHPTYGYVYPEVKCP